MRIPPVILAASGGLAALLLAAEITAGIPGPTTSSELYDPASGSWSATGDMVVSRESHTITLLSDGTVLVVGGLGNQGAGMAGPRTEHYDPATGKWEEVGSLHRGRSSHTATLFPNGNVLVAGGSGDLGRVATAEVWDRTTRICSQTGDLAFPRLFHTATLLPNGKVLVTGGFGETGTLAAAELYDPLTGTWSPTGSMNIPRQSHTATLLQNGKVLVVGGYGNDYAFPTGEVYDPASGTWSPTGPLNTPRFANTATLLANGKVLIAGGQTFIGGPSPHYEVLASAELYDPATGQYTVTGSMTEPRSSHAAALLLNGKVLIACGGGVYPLYSAELYDPASGTWAQTGSMDRKRGAMGGRAITLPSGKVLVAGGFVQTPAQLLNISTRAQVLSGDEVPIAGFIIPGFTYPGVPKTTVILRAIGPSLPLGNAALQDPVIELYSRNGQLMRRNDNWKVDGQTGESQERAIRDTTIPPSNDLESAMIAMLEPGYYTVVVRGKNGGTGIGLVEVYCYPLLGPVGNLSTRGLAGTGDRAMIGGFIAGEIYKEKANFLLRAMGPSLPLNGALADPTLELHDSNGATIALNDDWKIDSQTGQSQEAAIRATRVPPPPDDRESSIVARVAPGGYTAILRGKNGGTGIALFEVYTLD